VIIAKKYKIPDECPRDCRLMDRIQGGFCQHCPILNCSGPPGIRLIEPSEYKEEWAKEWAKFFRDGTEQSQI